VTRLSPGDLSTIEERAEMITQLLDLSADARLARSLALGLPRHFSARLAFDAAREDRRDAALSAARKSVKQSLRGIRRAAADLADEIWRERDRQFHNELTARRKANANAAAAEFLNLDKWRPLAATTKSPSPSSVRGSSTSRGPGGGQATSPTTPYSTQPRLTTGRRRRSQQQNPAAA
jgi:hypothetical protein